MADNTKYLWYSEQLSTISDDFDTEEECGADATKQLEDCVKCAEDMGTE